MYLEEWWRPFLDAIKYIQNYACTEKINWVNAEEEMVIQSHIRYLLCR